MTSASQIVMPVVRIDGRPVGNGAPGPGCARALRRRSTATRESGLMTADFRANLPVFPQLVLAPFRRRAM